MPNAPQGTLLIDPAMVIIDGTAYETSFIRLAPDVEIAQAITQISPPTRLRCSYCGTTAKGDRCESCGAPQP